ncbi:MAG: hypothetical protein LBE35_05955 [Clostridiales bacterium]|jgi:hypothetical protein|nr:hypothetical protein [Clostridiales bacterium]
MKKRLILAVLMAFAGLMIFTACDGPNSASWRTVAGNVERDLDGGFAIDVRTASRGTRNRTFELTAAELAAMHITSTSESGQIVLTISQDGNLDGSEIVLDISNFEGTVDATGLNPGNIRLSFQFEEIRNSQTTVSWR